MGAKVKNPRKKFLWSITFPKHPINTYLFQTCTLPDIEIEQVAHGDINRDVKTAGRVTIGNLTVEKLMTTIRRSFTLSPVRIQSMICIAGIISKNCYSAAISSGQPGPG